MLTRVPGRQTGDIDIVSEGLNDAVRDASRTVAARHNLTPAWINDGVKGFAVPIEVEPERIFTGKCLIVDSAGPAVSAGNETPVRPRSRRGRLYSFDPRDRHLRRR